MADDKKPKRGGARPKIRPDDRRGANFKAVDENGKPAGNQPHQITEKNQLMVREAAAKGQTQDIIARRLNISVATLNRHYHDQWQEGADEMLSDVAGKAVEVAMSGNAGLLIFLLKSRLGYKTTLQLSGVDNKPIDMNVNFDIGPALEQFDDDQLEAMENLLESARKQFSPTGTSQQPSDDSV